jgi:hypothetical protein
MRCFGRHPRPERLASVIGGRAADDTHCFGQRVAKQPITIDCAGAACSRPARWRCMHAAAGFRRPHDVFLVTGRLSKPHATGSTKASSLVPFIAERLPPTCRSTPAGSRDRSSVAKARNKVPTSVLLAAASLLAGVGAATSRTARRRWWLIGERPTSLEWRLTRSTPSTRGVCETWPANSSARQKRRATRSGGRGTRQALGAAMANESRRRLHALMIRLAVKRVVDEALHRQSQPGSERLSAVPAQHSGARCAYVGGSSLRSGGGRVANGATYGATVDCSRLETRMNAGAAPDWEVMIDHM